VVDAACDKNSAIEGVREPARDVVLPDDESEPDSAGRDENNPDEDREIAGSLVDGADDVGAVPVILPAFGLRNSLKPLAGDETAEAALELSFPREIVGLNEEETEPEEADADELANGGTVKLLLGCRSNDGCRMPAMADFRFSAATDDDKGGAEDGAEDDEVEDENVSFGADDGDEVDGSELLAKGALKK
jgi:hypothetical protein